MAKQKALISDPRHQFDDVERYALDYTDDLKRIASAISNISLEEDVFDGFVSFDNTFYEELRGIGQEIGGAGDRIGRAIEDTLGSSLVGDYLRARIETEKAAKDYYLAMENYWDEKSRDIVIERAKRRKNERGEEHGKCNRSDG